MWARLLKLFAGFTMPAATTIFNYLIAAGVAALFVYHFSAVHSAHVKGVAEGKLQEHRQCVADAEAEKAVAIREARAEAERDAAELRKSRAEDARMIEAQQASIASFEAALKKTGAKRKGASNTCWTVEVVRAMR